MYLPWPVSADHEILPSPITVAATIYVPADVCYMFCRQGMNDERWRAAYAMLRPGRVFSAQIVEEDPRRRLRISIGALSRSGVEAYPSLGFEIEYVFTEQGPDATFVEIIGEYSGAADRASRGTMEHQVENDTLHRLAALLALEAGYAIGGGDRG
jgi:hypothetical protein